MGRLPQSENIFVEVYDSWMDDEKAYKDWVDFFKKQGPFESILELACGTGNITGYLCSISDRYVATDIDDDMLQKAQAKTDLCMVEFQLADMRDFDLDETFDRIICGADSINFNQNLKQLRQTVSCVKKHLNPNGVFVFDVHHPDRLKTYKKGYIETGVIDNIHFEYELYSRRNKLYHDFYWFIGGYPTVQQFVQTIFSQKDIQQVFDPDTWELTVENEHGDSGFVSGEKWHIAAKLIEKRHDL